MLMTLHPVIFLDKFIQFLSVLETTTTEILKYCSNNVMTTGP